MPELRGLNALEAWGRKVTAGYPGVQVRDLSHSWKDGLAFCAIIHHFRPDLIDFQSLSKENVLYNNQLAFTIGEKLGIPALLEAEDMAMVKEPDRSCVALYLSGVYDCFVGNKKKQREQKKSGLARSNSVAMYMRSYSSESTDSETPPSLPTSPCPSD